MQFRVFPIGPGSLTGKGRAMKLQVAASVLADADVATEEEMSTLRADAHFIKGPPFLEWIGIPVETQSAPISLRKSHHQIIPISARFVRCELRQFRRLRGWSENAAVRIKKG